MNRLFRTAALIAGAGLALTGCSSDKIAEGQSRMLVKLLSEALLHKTPAKPHLTRAQITAFKAPLTEAELPKRDAKAYLLQVAQNGDVVTWSTTDGITISLRHGVLVQTRGLGQDLMSSAPLTAAAIRAGSGHASGTYYYLTGDDQSYAAPFSCTLAGKGRSTIEIASLRYAVRRVDATCTGKDLSFTNSYWVEANGTIRKSHQWVSPTVGYIDLADLRK